MAQRLNGRFYFKRTSNGNLLGEFSHNYLSGGEVIAESCDFRAKRDKLGEADPMDYDGVYFSTWSEGKKADFADLTISKMKGRVYKLEWMTKGEPRFVGEGMLCDDALIGDYSNVEKPGI